MAINRQVPKASDLIVDDIRRRILTERLPVGFRLPSETELAEDYRLGRVTVREALRLLENHGLIEIKRGPGGGVLVRHPDVTQLSDGFTVLFGMQDITLGEYLDYRILIEPQAAAWAAERATTEQREAILEAVNRETDIHSDFEEIHILIAEASGNGVNHLVTSAILSGNMVRASREDKIAPEDTEGSHFAHQKIATAIAAGDAEQAERYMRKHLLAYREYLEQVGLANEPIVPAATRPPWANNNGTR